MFIYVTEMAKIEKDDKPVIIKVSSIEKIYEWVSLQDKEDKATDIHFISGAALKVTETFSEIKALISKAQNGSCTKCEELRGYLNSANKVIELNKVRMLEMKDRIKCLDNLLRGE